MCEPIKQSLYCTVHTIYLWAVFRVGKNFYENYTLAYDDGHIASVTQKQ